MPYLHADILSRFHQRDTKALEEVYSLFYSPLCYFAEKMVSNRQAASASVVDVFVKTFQSTVIFSSIEHLKGYLFEGVKNQCLNYLKQTKRQEKNLQDYIDSVAIPDVHIHNELIETAALELVFEIAQGLPGECKRVFDLLYKERLNYQDIASTLQLNIQTVRNQNARAIAYIRKRLQTDCAPVLQAAIL